MAVYTDLTGEEAGALLAGFGLGPALSFKGIAEGVENSNFFVETREGRFILTIYEKRVRAEDLPFFIDLMDALAACGFPAPRPVRDPSGQALATVRGKPAALVTFLPGVSPTKPSAAQCRVVGAALARMHLALAGFAGRRENALSVRAWGPLVRPRLDLAESLRPGLAHEAQGDLAALEQTWPDGLPHGIIHADLFPDNALFLGEELGGVIDFYFACQDALAYDLAICLNAWCFEPRGGFNITKGRALIAGYQSARPLAPEEREALPILARGAAMRFFATRLADWRETDPGAFVRKKDPLDYAERLDFHRSARGASDYGA